MAAHPEDEVGVLLAGLLQRAVHGVQENARDPRGPHRHAQLHTHTIDIVRCAYSLA